MTIMAKPTGLAGKITVTVAAVLAASSMLVACKHTNMNNNKGLWIANGPNVLEYIPNQLQGGTGATVPHLAINSKSFGAPQGVTFDSAGNLWVMDPAAVVNGNTTPALLKFTAAQLAALATNNAPTPTATITHAGMKVPQQSVFDAAGNQWVADHDGNQILVFTAAQLAMTGTNELQPAVTITSPEFNGPLGIAFDTAGDLWVANNGGVAGPNNTASAIGTTIVEFLAKSLPMVPATGMLTPSLNPDVTLTNTNNSIQGPWELAFDSMGNLWASNAGAPFTLVEFAKANLMASGSPTPMVTISPTGVNGNATLSETNGLCFDSVGDVAATSAGSPFGLAFYLKGQIGMTGSPVPNTFVVGAATTLNAVAGCNFGPLVN